jgi:hypothetical protein
MSLRIDLAFLAKWRKEYYKHDNREYCDLIRKDTLTTNDLNKLLRWKSLRFSNKIKKKLERQLDEINALRKLTDESKLDGFVRKFYPSYPDQAPIFGTFIKHILSPDKFPVYDQFVHNAYHKLSGAPVQKGCLMNCYKQYCSFFMDVKARLGCSEKELDEALWAYGAYSGQ